MNNFYKYVILVLDILGVSLSLMALIVIYDLISSHKPKTMAEYITVGYMIFFGIIYLINGFKTKKEKHNLIRNRLIILLTFIGIPLILIILKVLFPNH